MGFTLTRNLNSSSVLSLPSVEQEAIAAANHNRMKVLAVNPPITIGVRDKNGYSKQITWAKAIAEGFLFHAHAWGFKAKDIDLLFANRGKSSKFWIDNRNPSGNSGEGVLRAAIEKEIAEMKRDRQLTLKSESMPESEKRSLARRF
jgi:hypothetical protein